MALSTSKNGYNSLFNELSRHFGSQVNEMENFNISNYGHILAERNCCVLIRLDSVIENYRVQRGHPFVIASDLDYLLSMLQIEYKLSITNLNQITIENMLVIVSDRLSENLYPAKNEQDFLANEREAIETFQSARETIARYSKATQLLPPLDWQNLPYDILQWKLVR